MGLLKRGPGLPADDAGRSVSVKIVTMVTPRKMTTQGGTARRSNYGEKVGYKNYEEVEEELAELIEQGYELRFVNGTGHDTIFILIRRD